MSFIRPKDGNPNEKFFESVETLNQFETIRKALQKKELKKVLADDQQRLTKDEIAKLVIQLLQFQEKHLGKQSNGSAPLMRIPVKNQRVFRFERKFSFPLDGMFSRFRRIRRFVHDHSQLLRIQKCE